MRRWTQDTGHRSQVTKRMSLAPGGWRRFALFLLVSCILCHVSAWPGHAEEAPQLTTITAERTERSVRLHLVIDGAPPAFHDVAFSGAPQLLLDPEGPLWTSLPQELTLTDDWIIAVRLVPDPTTTAAPGASYPISLIAIQTDQPRQHWVVSLASEVVVDLGAPRSRQRWSEEPTAEPGTAADDPAALGLTREALEGMLQVPTIPPLPQPPTAPMAAESRD